MLQNMPFLCRLWKNQRFICPNQKSPRFLAILQRVNLIGEIGTLCYYCMWFLEVSRPHKLFVFSQTGYAGVQALNVAISIVLSVGIPIVLWQKGYPLTNYPSPCLSSIYIFHCLSKQTVYL